MNIDTATKNRNILIRVVDECAIQEGGLSWRLDPRPQVQFHMNQWLAEVVKNRPEISDSICDLCYAQIYEAFVHECVEPMRLSTVGKPKKISMTVFKRTHKTEGRED